MKSVLIKLRDRTFKKLALISLFSAVLTACGGQEPANPKSVDLDGPAIFLNAPGNTAVIKTKAGTLVDIPSTEITFQSEDIIYYQKNDTDVAEVISIFSENYEDLENTDYSYGKDSATVNEAITYTNLDTQLIRFTTQNLSPKSFLHLEYQSDDSTILDISLTSQNVTTENKVYSLPIDKSQGKLVKVDIPLSYYTETDMSTVYQIKVEGDGTLNLSNIYFHGEKIDLSVEGEIVGFREIHKHGEIYTHADATAFDIFDGPVDPDHEIQESLKLDSADNDVGTHIITYTAVDDSENQTKLHRYIDIVDEDSPTVILLGESPIILAVGEGLPADDGATATDAVDDELDLVVTVYYTTENGSEEVSAVDPSIAGEYKIRYTYTDNASNSSYVERVIIVAPPQDAVVNILKDGNIDSTWNQGISAYDQDLNWGSCTAPNGCQNIGWELVYDSSPVDDESPDDNINADALDEEGKERGNVLQITHEATERGAGLIISSSSAIDLRGAEDNGFFTFDLMVTEGIKSISFNADCGYPCAGGPVTHTVADYGVWETVAVPVASLIPNGPNGATLDLERVRSGLVIQAFNAQYDDTKTVFSIDNVYYDCRAATCEGEFVPFVPVDWAATHEDPSDPADTTPTSYAGYTQVWADEFNGNAVNPLNWEFDVGTGNNGWGNGELQYYRPENASVEDGLLIIEARKHQPILNLGPDNTEARYTSSKLKSEGLFEFKYGRVDIRAVVAKGQGMWSAGWMLGANHSQIGWPYSGEIDIFDTIGGTRDGIPQEGMIVNNMYWNGQGNIPTANNGNYSPSNIANNGGGDVRINNSNEGTTFSNTFHTFSLVWDEDKVEFQLDGDTTKTVALLDGSVLADTYRNPFYLILNVAVGGAWPGAPDETTEFPDGMLVDYVRVYQADTDGDGTADFELDGDTPLDQFPNDPAQQ